MTFAEPPAGATSTIAFQGRFPGATAVIVCRPGSTGIASPHSAEPMTVSSRFTSMPVTLLASGTTIAMRDSFGSSAFARSRAAFSRAPWFAFFAAAATLRKPAHALAVRPRCS